jgi:hypothetical protein
VTPERFARILAMLHTEILAGNTGPSLLLLDTLALALADEATPPDRASIAGHVLPDGIAFAAANCQVIGCNTMAVAAHTWDCYDCEKLHDVLLCTPHSLATAAAFGGSS